MRLDRAARIAIVRGVQRLKQRIAIGDAHAAGLGNGFRSIDFGIERGVDGGRIAESDIGKMRAGTLWKPTCGALGFPKPPHRTPVIKPVATRQVIGGKLAEPSLAQIPLRIWTHALVLPRADHSAHPTQQNETQALSYFFPVVHRVAESMSALVLNVRKSELKASPPDTDYFR